MKRNKGITLIALVITIIVLLILAGVSIAMLTGQNGILTQANESKIWTELGNVDDAYKTHILGLQASNNGEKVDLNSLTDLLTKVTVGDSGYIYAIKDLSKLNLNMQSGKGEIPSNVAAINDFNDVYIVDEKGNVAYIIGDKIYGNIELAEGQKPTREDFFEFNEETGTITGIVENTTKDPNGVGYYYDDEGNQILSEKNIVIPSSINGVPVTAIADLAFSMSDIESVVIPNSVTKIGNFPNVSYIEDMGAFKNCRSLKSVTLPNSIDFLGACTFYQCDSLASITIPNSVTIIGNRAFEGCTSLTSITISDGVTSIGSDAFYNCSALTNITIPDSVTTIGSSAFYNCSSLIDITISDNIVELGSSVFSDTVWYNNQPNGDLYVGKCYYKYKGTMPENAEVTIRIGTKGIAASAFSGCTTLTNITIPGSVSTIGDAAFSGCTTLTNITIPGSVSTIGDAAFRDCTTLTNITIPGSVSTIGDYAFYNCTSLTDITIPDNVTVIESSTFYNCTSLTDITIPESVNTIKNKAFYNCSSLKNVKIPDSVTSMDWDVFYNINSNANIYCEAKSKPRYWSSSWTNLSSSRIHWGSTGPTE